MFLSVRTDISCLNKDKPVQFTGIAPIKLPIRETDGYRQSYFICNVYEAGILKRYTGNPDIQDSVY